MKTARVFRSGNSQAVRIPKEFRTSNEDEFKRVPGLAVENWL